MRNVNVIPNDMKRVSSLWNNHQTHLTVRKKLTNYVSYSFSS